MSYLRQIFLVFSIASCNQPFLLGDTNIQSSAFGLGAINLIESDESLRKSVSITDEQLSEIREILSQKVLFRNLDTRESVARKHLSEILTREQAELLRIEVVKRKIGAPENFFIPLFLGTELGLEDDKASMICDSFSVKKTRISQDMDKRRIQAIKNAIPLESQDIVWKYLGKDFSISDKEIEKVELIPDMTPSLEVNLATRISLPQKLSLSLQQIEELRRVGNEVSRRNSSGEPWSEEEVEQILNTTLTKRQRFAIQQGIIQLIVRRDLSTIVNTQMSRMLNLTDEQIAEARTKLIESNKTIKKTELELQVQACRDVLEDMPLPARKIIKELSAGIWDL